MQLFEGRSFRLTTLIIGALVIALTAQAAPSVAIDGTRFDRKTEVDGTTFELRNVGTLRWLFFKGYAAALYMTGDDAPKTVLRDVPKRLELHYFREVPAQAIGDAAQVILERNVSASELRGIQKRVDQIAGLYVDIAPGDRYALTYRPGEGTELAYNGKPVATIPGSDFAAAYFAIWLGQDPIDVDLRDQLVGIQ